MCRPGRNAGSLGSSGRGIAGAPHLGTASLEDLVLVRTDLGTRWVSSTDASSLDTKDVSVPFLWDSLSYCYCLPDNSTVAEHT